MHSDTSRVLFAAVIAITAVNCVSAQSKPIVRERRDLGERFDEGKKWAVVVGVSDYTSAAIPDLRYCVDDARLVAKTLIDHCGYPTENVLVMTDDQSESHRRPTRVALEEQVPLWLKEAVEGDTVFVFFSGHGFLDARGQGYLATQESDKKNLGLTSLRTDDLREMLRQCRASQKLLVLDCCHSGGEKRLDTPASSEEVGRSFRVARGLVTLASCGKDEVSQEWDEKRQGLFTYHLCEGLSGSADKDRDGLVTSDELYAHTHSGVSQTARRLFGASQEPRRLIGEDVVGVFALARSRVRAEDIPPTELRVEATFTVKTEGEKSHPIGRATIELWYKPKLAGKSQRLNQSVTDERGECQIAVHLDAMQQSGGEFAVRVTHADASKTWRLTAFPQQRRWELTLPGEVDVPETAPANPFAKLPTSLKLPSVNEAQESPKMLGVIALRSKEICYIDLVGGEKAMPKEGSVFTMDLARNGLAERDWEIKLVGTPKGDIIVAQLAIAGNELTFRWTPEGARLADAEYLANCHLNLRTADFDHNLALREP